MPKIIPKKVTEDNTEDNTEDKIPKTISEKSAKGNAEHIPKIEYSGWSDIRKSSSDEMWETSSQ